MHFYILVQGHEGLGRADVEDSKAELGKEEKMWGAELWMERGFGFQAQADFLRRKILWC